MNKIKVFIIVANVSISCLGQINFEKGYFINNENNKIDCLIKNNDWLKNPTSFKYKLIENGEIKDANITEIKEFSIINSSKFIRADVNIDTSSSLLKKLSTVKDPLWLHKQIFLKVLIEGKANLYYYTEGNYERFFYLSKDTVIKQLIYKEYYYNDDQTAYNNAFRQQLFSDVSCYHTTLNSVKNLDYDQFELEKYFQHYNSCLDSSYKVYEIKHKKGESSLAFSTGFTYSSLSISNYDKSYVSTKFDKKLNPIFSFELEYIFPFNNYKWGLALSPTFQSYKSEKQNNYGYVTVDLKSVDLALGLKHYFYLNNKAKFFVDFHINSILVKCLDSKIGYKANTTQNLSYIDIERFKINFILGVGLEYKRIFTELRYFSNQDILLFHPGWNSSYEKISFNIGYKILKTRHKA